MNWYELPFDKQSPKDIKNKDHATFRKLSVMAEAYVQIQKDMKDSDKEEVWFCNKVLFIVVWFLLTYWHVIKAQQIRLKIVLIDSL